MRKLAFIPLLLIAAQAVTVSCRMAPSQDDGDTVAAKEFYPPDTAALRKAAANDSTVTKAVTDSADIFVIGPASTKHEVQLLSYPSRRDSTLYYKSRRIKVRGNADVGHKKADRWPFFLFCNFFIVYLSQKQGDYDT